MGTFIIIKHITGPQSPSIPRGRNISYAILITEAIPHRLTRSVSNGLCRSMDLGQYLILGLQNGVVNNVNIAKC